MKIELHDANYWITRPMDSERDWVDEEKDWIESYVMSANHPHRQLIMDAISDLQPLGSVLEVGCNVGSNLLRVNELYPLAKLAGIDLNKKCIDRASQFLDKAILKVGNCMSIPFADGDFDVVIADAVLMYLNPTDIEQAMSEICRVNKRAIIIVERFNASKKGVRNGHVWARNYPAILKKRGYNIVKIKKIRKKDWPNSIGWQSYGFVVVAEK